MSLKHDIEEYPEMWSKEIVAALEDYKNGKRNSKRKLRKFVNREISEHYYNELIKRYDFWYRINKDKKDRERSRKKKAVLCGVVAFVVLFVSMACGLVYFFEQYGKAIAVCYFFLWFWAIDYAVDKDTKSKKITKLELENELLKERLEIYKEVNKKSEATLQE